MDNSLPHAASTYLSADPRLGKDTQKSRFSEGTGKACMAASPEHRLLQCARQITLPVPKKQETT